MSTDFTLDDKAMTVGGKAYPLTKLTLRQLRDIVPKLAEMGGQDTVTQINTSADIVATALARSDKTITQDTVLDMELSLKDLGVTVNHIAKMSGLAVAPETPSEAVTGTVANQGTISATGTVSH